MLKSSVVFTSISLGDSVSGCSSKLKGWMHNRLLSNVWPFFFSGFVSIFACGLRFSQQTLACIFFCWFTLRFREITYAKNSVFLAASFGDLLSNEKQNKPFVSLNKEVSEASY